MYKALIRSIMTYACPTWEFAAETHLMKLQRLQNRFLRSISNVDRCTSVRDLHSGFKIPYVYDYITKLCRRQAVTKMILIKNYFLNTVLNILHNKTRRITFQTYNHGAGGENWRENRVILCLLTAQIRKCNSEAKIYFRNIWIECGNVYALGTNADTEGAKTPSTALHFAHWIKLCWSYTR
jgi:hypothetical protein